MFLSKEPHSGRQAKSSGFTLVELCIVMLVIGISLAAVMPLYSTYIVKQRMETVEKTVDTVRAALANYIADDPLNQNDPAEKRYPCPASPEAPIGSAKFGVENCALRSAGVGTCKEGICVRAGTGGKKVLIGTVPTRTLEIAGQYMVDPYKNRLTYAVTSDLAAPGAMNGTTGNSTGAITIVDEGATITPNAQFSVFSHGRDGTGSYSYSGVKNDTRCRTSPLGDAENCNDNAVFRAAEYAEGSGDTYYDDTIAFDLTKSEDQPPSGVIIGMGLVATIYSSTRSGNSEGTTNSRPSCGGAWGDAKCVIITRAMVDANVEKCKKTSAIPAFCGVGYDTIGKASTIACTKGTLVSVGTTGGRGNNGSIPMNGSSDSSIVLCVSP